MAATDPERAERIATDAERAAEAETYSVATSDLSRAERVAEAITYDSAKVEALIKIAEAMAAGPVTRS